uniref:Toxin candidate TRINITY_DN19498_c0_g1_i1 n=1 Tax=Pachycerianthus borealis TaxID=2736680 RepID=A0A7G7WZ03_9CNID|nr:toxin candidate TRINITY_DN19498_c0_g1_i1 [Pachycerianthus borealis]QNH72550.1 toxin candidate TRINITY_DN19498_c0_g1_i1 [Pachycerianthus borealis]
MRVQLTVCFLLVLVGTSLAKMKDGKKKNRTDKKAIQTCAEINCNKLCTTRQHEKTPFCGSDNITYKTRCDFCMAKCRAIGEGKTVTIKSRKACKEKAKTSKHLNKKIRNMNRKQKRGPHMSKRCPSPKRCSPSSKTFCSNTNVTYTSMCLFKVAQCQALKSGHSLKIQYRGSCGSKKECPKLEQCKIVPRTLPVCGDNNVTYQTHCHFRVAACEAREMKQKLRMLHRGECGTKVKNQRTKCIDKPCRSDPKPLCGSDQKTYANSCEFLKAKCALKNKKSQLKLVYHGVCGAKKQAKRCRNQVPCKHKNMPVCGTDGKQYSSPCHLQKANCEVGKGTTIKIKNRGTCV